MISLYSNKFLLIFCIFIICIFNQQQISLCAETNDYCKRSETLAEKKEEQEQSTTSTEKQNTQKMTIIESATNLLARSARNAMAWMSGGQSNQQLVSNLRSIFFKNTTTRSFIY